LKKIQTAVLLMIQNPQVTADNFILQNSTTRNIDPVAMVSNDDDSSFQGHTSAESNISWDSQMVKF